MSAAEKSPVPSTESQNPSAHASDPREKVFYIDPSIEPTIHAANQVLVSDGTPCPVRGNTRCDDPTQHIEP